MTTSKLLFAVSALSYLLSANTAYAEIINNNNLANNKAFLAYASSTAILSDAADIAKKFDNKFQLARQCKAAYTIKPTKITIFKPLDFDGKHVNDGAWKMNYEASRCGEVKLYNILFVGQKGTVPMVIPYYPGTTAADYKLVTDVMRTVTMGASMLTKRANCDDMSIFDMVVTKQPQPDKKFKNASVWEESWTVQACNERVTVPIKFFPGKEGKGYDFTISVKPVKRN